MNGLVRMRMETRSRGAEQADMELQLSAYAERLSAWPIADVERVLSEWPRRSEFWPTWHELAEQLPSLEPQRPQLAYSAPEHRPMVRRDSSDDHAPFKTRCEWDDFAEAMRSLRNPLCEHFARDALLKIGNAIEARQRPHAERMGWA